MQPAVVLLSGGLDSATCLAIARDQGFATYAMSFAYGQRHRTELHAAMAVARDQGAARHVIVNMDLRLFGGSALTDDIPVPKHDSVAELDTTGIPVLYVPARNTIFLGYALAYAETVGARDIFIGANALDYTGYPDCRPEYYAAFNAMAALATKTAVEGAAPRIHTPLIDMTKAQIVEVGMALGVDYSVTSSCYEPGPDGEPCGRCDACLLRRQGFVDAGYVDPLVYATT